MIKALKYKDEVPPSSAIEEMVQSISTTLENGEQALISYVSSLPITLLPYLGGYILNMNKG